MSKRKGADKLLKQSMEQYQQQLDLSRDAIVQTSLDGRILFCNQRAAVLFGYEDSEELIGMESLEFFSSEDRDIVIRNADNILREGSLRNDQYRMLKRDGTVMLVEVNASLITDAQGNPDSFKGIIRDISERKNSEETLATSEEAYRYLFDHSPHPLMVVDMETLKFLEANETALRGYGYSKEEFLSLTAEKIHSPQDMHAAIREITRKGKGTEEIGVWRHCRKDGTLFNAEVTTRRIQFKDRKAKLILAVDMTNRVRVEESLRENGRLLETLSASCEISKVTSAELKLQDAYKMTNDILENAPYGIFVVSNDGRINYVNSAMLQISGDSYEHFISLNIDDIPSYKDFGITKHIKAVLSGDSFFLGPIKYTSHLGRKTTIRNFLGIPLGNEQERSAIIFVEDVTARHEAKELSTRLAAAVKSVSDAITITDTQGIIEYVNPAFETIMGYTYDEAAGMSSGTIDTLKADKSLWANILDTLENGKAWNGRITNTRKNGTSFEEDYAISPIMSASGQLRNFAIVSRDVTENVMLEAIASSVETMNNIGYVISGIRHQIGNPVNSMKILLGLIRKRLDSGTDTKSKEQLDMVISELGQIEYLLKSLKNFSMFEKPKSEAVKMNDFMERFLALVMEDFQNRGIKVKTIFYPDVERAFVDPRALQQVLLNVLANAADAVSDKEEPRITISMLRESRWIKIFVHDNGPGIPEELQRNLFRPFHTTKLDGTGLGLVLARKMLAMMDSSISISSIPGEGTAVEICIPEEQFADESG